MILNTTTILRNGFTMPFKTISLRNDYPLSTRDPFANLESLRQELLEIIEQRLDEIETVAWAKLDMQFHFVRSQMVVFDTRETLKLRSNWWRLCPKCPWEAYFIILLMRDAAALK